MIVVDTNIVAYLLIGGKMTPYARKALKIDPVWAAPLLWRSEFRNVLAYYMGHSTLSLTNALQFMRAAELLFHGMEYQVESIQVIELVDSSRCSAYDCEFVALAREFGVSLVTTDNQILKEFPDIAVPLKSFSS